jgi:hypothetical protein
MSTPPSSNQPTPSPPRGWYTDPGVANQERWWNGTIWTEYTHKSNTVRYTLLGPQYARAWWRGPNEIAWRSSVLGRITLLLSVFGTIFVLAVIYDARASTKVAVLVVYTAVVVFGAAVALAWGIIGARRAPQLGGLLLAGWGIGLACFSMAVCSGLNLQLILEPSRF